MSRDFIGSTIGRSFRESPNRDRITRGSSEVPVGGVYQAFVEWRIDYNSSIAAINASFESVLVALSGNVMPTSPGVLHYGFDGSSLFLTSDFELPGDLPLSSGDRGSFLSGWRINFGPSNQFIRLRALRSKTVLDEGNVSIGTARPICVFDLTADRQSDFFPDANYTHVVIDPDCAPVSGLINPPSGSVSGRVVDFKIDMMPPHPTTLLAERIITPTGFAQREAIQVRREFAFRNDLGAVVKAVTYLSFPPPTCCNLSA